MLETLPRKNKLMDLDKNTRLRVMDRYCVIVNCCDWRNIPSGCKSNRRPFGFYSFQDLDAGFHVFKVQLCVISCLFKMICNFISADKIHKGAMLCDAASPDSSVNVWMLYTVCLHHSPARSRGPSSTRGSRALSGAFSRCARSCMCFP